MNVIVTGGTGFLGHALIKELSENGDRVIAIVRPNSKKVNRISNIKNVEIVFSELSEEIILPKYDYNVFYHLAWEGERDNFVSQSKNIGLTVKCIEIAHKNGCKKFICTGSQAEYGETDDIITEATPTLPNTSYGSAKVAAYYLSRDYARHLGIEHIWVRVFSVYGENDNPNTLYSKLCSAMKKDESFVMNTDGNHIWNFLHETDAARALRLLGITNVSEGVYNLSSNYCAPLFEYIEKIRTKNSLKKLVEYGDIKCKVNLKTYSEKLRKAVGEFEMTKFPKDY